MRTIVKGKEPRSLVAHRQTSHSGYDNYRDKKTLRIDLVTEQRGLCCYCMGRIEPGAQQMKIEHWRSRARYPDDQLNYRNLLGACLGGEGKSRRLQHCDTRKGDRDLRWNPADPTHSIETRLRYLPDGVIKSDDGWFDTQLNEVLNLNHSLLRKNRQKVLDAVLQWWRKEKKPVPRARIERQRDKYDTQSGELSPYCQVAVWWLQQKLE